MENENIKNSKVFYIFKLAANDAVAVFPYLFAFYLISLFVSIFFTDWRGFLNWPAFHFGVIFFALISLGSDKAKTFWKGVKDDKVFREGIKLWNKLRGIKSFIPGAFSFVSKTILVFRRVVLIFKKFLILIFVVFLVPAFKKVILPKGKMRKSHYVKFAVILLVLAFSLFQGINVLEFFVLFFGFISVFFGLDMRISAGCALALLVLIPILLAFGENTGAEAIAVYAYYFLVITVFTGLGDYVRGESMFYIN